MTHLKSIWMLICAVLQQQAALFYVLAFLIQLGFLIYTKTHPAIWKWVVLLSAEIISLAFAGNLLLEAHNQDHLGYLYLSLGCLVFFALLFFYSLVLFLLQKQAKNY